MLWASCNFQETVFATTAVTIHKSVWALRLFGDDDRGRSIDPTPRGGHDWSILDELLMTLIR